MCTASISGMIMYVCVCVCVNVHTCPCRNENSWPSGCPRKRALRKNRYTCTTNSCLCSVDNLSKAAYFKKVLLNIIYTHPPNTSLVFYCIQGTSVSYACTYVCCRISGGIMYMYLLTICKISYYVISLCRRM